MRRRFESFRKRKRRTMWGITPLRANLESYVEKLSKSGLPVDLDEVSRAHTARLQIDDRVEFRLRSIQSLLEAGYEKGVVPAISELMLACSDWPDAEAAKDAVFLLELLKGFLGKNELHLVATLSGVEADF